MRSKTVRTQIIVLIAIVTQLVDTGALLFDVTRFVTGSMILFYLPGYRWSYVFFASDEISLFERFVVSMAISVACIFYASLYISFFGVAMTPLIGMIISIGLALVAGLVLWGNYLNSAGYWAYQDK